MHCPRVIEVSFWGPRVTSGQDARKMLKLPAEAHVKRGIAEKVGSPCFLSTLDCWLPESSPSLQFQLLLRDSPLSSRDATHPASEKIYVELYHIELFILRSMFHTIRQGCDISNWLPLIS